MQCEPTKDSGGKKVNPNTLQAKKAEVAELAERLKTANCVLIMSYEGLDVKSLTQLRIGLHHVEADDQPVKAGLEIRKNTLVKRALEEENDKDLEALLKGANALITCEDSIAALKTVSDFCEDHSKFAVVKGGLVDHTFMDAKSLAEIAACGSRKGILAMLLSTLEAGMRNLALDIKAVAEKKQAEAPAAPAAAAPAQA